MRSLPQKIVLLLLFLFHSTTYAQNTINDAQLFTVVMPYETQDLEGQSVADQRDAKVKEAMKSLLLRLTGRPEILQTQIGQRYIGKAKNWLANYNLKQRYEDGVAVGKNIHYKFDSTRLKIDFSNKNIQIWPVHMRPRTLIMGSYIQQGQLQKLTDEILDYRIDVDFRERPAQLGLPFLIADNGKNWIYPMDSEENRLQIQEALLASGQQSLLSFNLIAKSEGLYSLDWSLSSMTGKLMNSGKTTGEDRHWLLEQMFQQVMQSYVKHSAEQVVVKNDLLLNISGVKSGLILTRMEAELKAEQPMVRRVMLTSASKAMIQFHVEYLGDDQIFKTWLHHWPMVKVVPQAVIPASKALKTANEPIHQPAHNTEEVPTVEGPDVEGSEDVEHVEVLEHIDLMFNPNWVPPEQEEVSASDKGLRPSYSVTGGGR